MIRIEKVYEPNYDSIWCRRCDEYYCLDCVSFEKVEFDINENAYENRPDLKPFIQNWKDEEVCPYCFNQLIDKAFPPTLVTPTSVEGVKCVK